MRGVCPSVGRLKERRPDRAAGRGRDGGGRVWSVASGLSRPAANQQLHLARAFFMRTGTVTARAQYVLSTAVATRAQSSSACACSCKCACVHVLCARSGLSLPFYPPLCCANGANVCSLGGWLALAIVTRLSSIIRNKRAPVSADSRCAKCGWVSPILRLGRSSLSLRVLQRLRVRLRVRLPRCLPRCRCRVLFACLPRELVSVP